MTLARPRGDVDTWYVLSIERTKWYYNIIFWLSSKSIRNVCLLEKWASLNKYLLVPAASSPSAGLRNDTVAYVQPYMLGTIHTFIDLLGVGLFRRSRTAYSSFRPLMYYVSRVALSQCLKVQRRAFEWYFLHPVQRNFQVKSCFKDYTESNKICCTVYKPTTVVTIGRPILIRLIVVKDNFVGSRNICSVGLSLLGIHFYLP